MIFFLLYFLFDFSISRPPQIAIDTSDADDDDDDDDDDIVDWKEVCLYVFFFFCFARFVKKFVFLFVLCDFKH